MNKAQLIKCPNCKTMHNENEFNPSFRYATLIECPDCIKKIKPNNRAEISNMPRGGIDENFISDG